VENCISKLDSFIPDGKTKFCFLFGSNIVHSLSPAMHSTWFQSNNLNCVYLPLQIQDEKEFLTILKSLTLLQGFLGGNITLPFKNCALKMDFVKQSEGVKATQAANTIFRNQLGQWCFENTDIKGIEASIHELVAPHESFEMIVLGGGGAAATSIYWGIKNRNCSNIICITRDPEKTLKNYDYLDNEKKFSIYKLDYENINLLLNNIPNKLGKIVLINTLPLGLDDVKSVGSYGEENFFALEIIKKLSYENCCYFDLIYNDTKAIKFANEKGIKNINGKLMLKTQAKESFLLWTGVQIMN
jgi:shikimate dehydrogenase